MTWHAAVAFFFGGAFLANFVPHHVAGVSGRSFYTPFAKPPFRGLSPPRVNILWGLVNLVVAYVLLVVVGGFELSRVADVAIAALGFGLASVGIARSIRKLQLQAAATASPHDKADGGISAA
jgi:hypothetical protein